MKFRVMCEISAISPEAALAEARRRAPLARRVYTVGFEPGVSARNPQGNLFFEGATLYSYRTGYPIARIYEKRKGAMKRCSVQGGALLNATVRDAMTEAGVLVLICSERYSVTTNRHINLAERAASHLRCVTVPRVVTDDAGAMRDAHEENLKYLADLAESELRHAERAMLEWRFDSASAASRKATEDCAHYMAFFGIRRKAPQFPSDRYNAALARLQRILNPNPASTDKRERASAKRKAKNQARDEYLAEQRRSVRAAKLERDFYRVGAARSNWRLDGAWGEDYEDLRSSPVMLRFCPTTLEECIETSYGARVPVAAAPMVWSLVERARAEGGRNWHAGLASVRAGRMVRIGDYPLDRIDADGTLHAGCHIIPHSELRSMARQLGLA